MIPNCLRLDLPLKRMQKPKQKTSSSIPLHCNVNGRHPAEKGQYLKIIAFVRTDGQTHPRQKAR
jgi:hypothetical protein